MDRFLLKEILVDAKSNSFGDDVEVSSREIVLRMVSDGLKRESRRVSSGESKRGHNLVKQNSREGVSIRREWGIGLSVIDWWMIQHSLDKL